MPRSGSRTIGPCSTRTSAPSSIGFSVSRSSAEHVLDLLAVEEARAAAGQVRNALAAQLVLELAREHADRVREDRDVGERAAADVQAADRLRDRARLGARVGRHQHRHRPAPPEPRVATRSGSAAKSGSRRMKSVAQSRISWYERRLCVSGRRRPRKARADVLDLGVAPAVDRLLRVADHGDVAEAVGGEQPDEVELDAVGVLELVDEQVAEPLAAAARETRARARARR